MINVVKSDYDISDVYLQTTKIKTVKNIYEISFNNIEIQRDKDLEDQIECALTKYEVETYDHFKEYHDATRTNDNLNFDILHEMVKDNREIIESEEIKTNEYNIDLIEENFNRI